MIEAPNTLIAVALPLDAIITATAREKFIRRGPPSTLLLSTFDGSSQAVARARPVQKLP